MKQLCLYQIVSCALGALLMASNSARAEIPNQSKEQLQESASHVLTGNVERTYEHTEQRGDFEYTYNVAEIAVERVYKGSDIVAGDRVFVRYWGKSWRRDGNPPPDHYGHRNVPQKTNSVEVFLKGDRKNGFDVLSPNGFYKVRKLKMSSR